MADANNNNNENDEHERNQAPEDPNQGLDFIEILRMLVVMITIQFLVQGLVASFQSGQSGESNINVTSTPESSSSETILEPTIDDNSRYRRKPAGVTTSARKKFHTSLWNLGTVMDLDLYITEDKLFPYSTVDPSKNVNLKNKRKKEILASWHEKNLVFNNHPSNQRNMSLTLGISDRLQSNETILYAHMILKRVQNDKLEKKDILKKTFELTKFKLRKKKRNEKSLLGEQSDEPTGLEKFTDLELEDNTILGKAARNFDEDVMLLYVKPSVDLQLVDFSQPFGRGTFNGDSLYLFNFYHEDESYDEYMSDNEKKSIKDIDINSMTGEPADYYPILHPSGFWVTEESLIPINGTINNVTINFHIGSLPMWKFTFMAQLEQQWKMQESISPGSSDSDMLRSILLDTNPILLVITFIVTVLHSLFDFLAFKNDISFFKGKRSMEGLSVRSMVVNTFFQIVIFFYLMDNDTSKMVLISNGIGLLIEFWKITKAIQFTWEGGRLQWKETSSYAKTTTKEYDEIATDHLLFVTFPLVLGYGMYSLVHMKHKGWYSWILSTLVGFIYMFGFVMMTPQLFINYKLQSVAHLNWRTMTYKSVNTFIDDLFAFIIKMPIMHRLACLRDDVIFFIFLYQRYKYRTDYTRVNEFGQCEQPTEDMIKEAESMSSTTPSSQTATSSVTAETQNANEVKNTTVKRRGARDKLK